MAGLEVAMYDRDGSNGVLMAGVGVALHGRGESSAAWQELE